MMLEPHQIGIDIVRKAAAKPSGTRMGGIAIDHMCFGIQDAFVIDEGRYVTRLDHGARPRALVAGR